MNHGEDDGRSEPQQDHEAEDRQQPKPAEDADKERQREERERDEARFSGAHKDPFEGEADPAAAHGAADVYREARTGQGLHGAGYAFDDTMVTGGHFGDAYYHYQLRPVPPLLAGPVSVEELETLRGVHTKPEGYAAMKRVLTDLRVLALCGEPGSGRSYTALHLLDGLTEGRVLRLDPTTDLTQLSEGDVADKHGYLIELNGSRKGVQPTGMHLDRLSSLLTAPQAYCVLLVDGHLADGLSHGPYGHKYLAPAASDMLACHLGHKLQGEPKAVQAALQTADRADVKDALGLDELRPQEAFWLAELLADHHRGALSEKELLTGCQEFAFRQAHAWFAGIDTADSLPEALPALRTAAFRIALAVLNGASYNAVAEAGELLVAELAATLERDSTPGRPLFADELGAWLPSARATLAQEHETVGSVQVPVRTVRFLGDRLSPAVLEYIWARHHNVRRPVIRWLQGLCDDPRTQVWTRAANAAGRLSAQDYTHTFEEMVPPLATNPRVRQQMFAAVSINQAARFGAVRPAITARVRDWGRFGGRELRRTAAMVHGFGSVAGSVAASLTELARIGTWEDGELVNVAGFSVVQLLGGDDRQVVLERIADWVADDRRERVDLGLVSIVRMAHTRAVDVWNPEVAGNSAPNGLWPLPLALVDTEPDLADLVASLLRRALATPRSREATVGAVGDWIGRAAEGRYLDALVGFLPRLVGGFDDAERLRAMVRRRVKDPDDPLDKQVARTVWYALEEAGV